MRKTTLFLLLAVVAVSTVFLMGCPDGGGGTGGGNPFVGTWTGEFTGGEGAHYDFTIDFTESTWTETCTGGFEGTISGTYVRSGNTATLTTTVRTGTYGNQYEDGHELSASISGTILTIGADGPTRTLTKS
ncbi:hypothetical protein FACS189485_11720 [Spirochaetia bacterium]|nr:hypothetical protein FACS189485_11720 [Spirochaetia bacterium]